MRTELNPALNQLGRPGVAARQSAANYGELKSAAFCREPLRRAGLLLCLLGCATAFVARAGTITVTNANDSGPGTLRQAIIGSTNGDNTIIFGSLFESQRQRIVINSQLVISGNLTINGPKTGVIIDAALHDRIFAITAGNVSISNIWMQNGSAAAPQDPVNCYPGIHSCYGDPENGNTGGGAMQPQGGAGILNQGNLTLMNCSISYCQAAGTRGYDCNYFPPIPPCTDCIILPDGSSIDGHDTIPSSGGHGFDGGNACGGAIWNQGSLVMKNCTLYANNAWGGEGGNGIGGPNPTHGARGYGLGGAICDNGTLTMESCTVYNNYAESSGKGVGGIYIQGTFTFGNCIIANNRGAHPDIMNGGYIGWVLCFNALSTIVDEGFNLMSVWELTPTHTDLRVPAGQTLEPNYLGFFQDNGGPTPTLAPLPGSLVIDQGKSFGLATDQCGKGRQLKCQGAKHFSGTLSAGGDYSDIGAVEYHPAPPNLNFEFVPHAGGGVPAQAKLSWVEDVALTALPGTRPNFGTEMIPASLLSSAVTFTPVSNPVRLINQNQYLVKLAIPTGSGGDSLLMRLNSSVTNAPFIPPAFTLPATQVSSNSAMFNGTTTPFGNGTKYWFQWGTDTNYDQSTPTNTLATSPNPFLVVALSNSITGLTPYTPYHYQLMVEDEDSTNAGSDKSFTTLPPPGPFTLPATNITGSSATFQGSDTPTGNNTMYWFEYGLDSSYPNYDGSTTTNPLATSSGLTYLSFTNASLEPLGLYHVQIVIQDDSGTYYGGDRTFNTGVRVTLPSLSPANAVGISSNSAALAGGVNPNGGDTLAYFLYGTNTDYTGGQTTSELIGGANLEPVPVPGRLAGLQPVTLYHYQLVATNSAGVTNGPDQTFTTYDIAISNRPPTVPGALTLAAFEIGTNSAVLNGEVVASGADTTCYYQFGTASNNYTQTWPATPGLVTAQDFIALVPNLVSGLNPGTTYHFRLVASNYFGAALGADQSFTTTTPALPPVVTTLPYSPIGPNTVLLQGAVNGEGTAFTGYFQYWYFSSFDGRGSWVTNQTSPHFNGPADFSSHTVSSVVTNLLTARTYYYRTVAFNLVSVGYGTNLTFLSP